MTFWKNNRTDKQYELTDSELFDKFAEYAKINNWAGGRGSEYFFRIFIMEVLKSTYEEKEFGEFLSKNRDKIHDIAYGEVISKV